ncbi:MAG: hypothetical protein J6334_10590 [Kiritimatiellae bacterium]|nr:hypothetical protein [Kiritimatiellia bacterium]
MWSKTRQVLESKLAEDLKGRVRYQYDVYRTQTCKDKPGWNTEMHVLSIIVDGKPWFCTNPNNWKGDLAVIRDNGIVGGWGSEMKHIHQFLNVLSIDEAISHENYFIRLLAVLDARLGKRRIKALADNIENEPEWFRKWIRLRTG